MTDAALAEALAGAKTLEAETRAYWQTAGLRAERESALDVVRHITPVIRDLETWISSRALRAHAVGE